MTDPHRDQPVVAAGAPLGSGRGVVVMVHGRNAGPANILDLVPHLDSELTYLAPAAAGGTWYPYGFMAETSRNEPSLTSALHALERVLRQIADRGIDRRRVALLGFSQGACLASEFVVRHADRYGGLIAFSGGLIGPPGTAWNHPGQFDGMPVFLGCSDIDPHIPEARVRESAEVLAQMGARVTVRIYPGMAHTINDDELELARSLLSDMKGVKG